MQTTNGAMLGMPAAVFEQWKVHKTAAIAERAAGSATAGVDQAILVVRKSAGNMAATGAGGAEQSAYSDDDSDASI